MIKSVAEMLRGSVNCVAKVWLKVERNVSNAQKIALFVLLLHFAHSVVLAFP